MSSTATVSELTPSTSCELPPLEIVRAATLAPSPDNNQPWRFRFEGDKLIVAHDAARALPSDVDRLFDLQSLGAAIENACIAARQFGFEGTLRCLSKSAESEVACLEWRPGATSDPLFPFLEQRRTNRRLFSRRPVPEKAIERLSREARSAAPAVQVDWISERTKIRRLAGLVAAGDRARFERREFHAELYRQLRFTPDEVEQTRDGLDVRLLALPPAGVLALRMIRPWSVMRLLNGCGLHRLLTLPSAAAVWGSGDVAVLSVAADGPENFLAAGRALQRFWLAASSEQLSVHPLGSLPILLRRLKSAEPSASCVTGLVPPGAALEGRDERIGRALREMLPALDRRTVTMVLRIGYGPEETGKSLRRPPNDVLA